VSKTQAKGGRFAALAPNQQGKTVTKRTPVDRFNDNRQSETERLTSKRKMEHDEKMASIQLKKRKYELRFRSESTPTHGSGSPRPAACAPSESEEIQVLRLKIRLAELTGGRAFLSPTQHDSLTPSTPSSPFGAAITYADSYATLPPTAMPPRPHLTVTTPLPLQLGMVTTQPEILRLARMGQGWQARGGQGGNTCSSSMARMRLHRQVLK
jgi:hypothetical protein